LLCRSSVQAQLAFTDSAANKLTGWMGKLKTRSIEAMDKQYERMEKRLTRQTENYLKKLQKQEAKLRKQVARKDSLKAQQMFGQTESYYKGLLSKLQQPSTGKLQNLNSYIPAMDSLQTTGKFLNQYSNKLQGVSPDKLAAFQGLNSSISQLQQKMSAAADIKAQLRQRKEQFKQQLDKQFNQALAPFNKQVYYYQAQVDEYKALLSDPDKLAKQLLSWVRTVPAFQGFMSRNSQLAALFGGGAGGAGGSGGASLAGLQSRTDVNNMLQQAMGSGGGNPQQYLQQQTQAAQNQLNDLKNKVNGLGGNSSDMAMPDFKPNSQKTKSFLKRLEYGLNIQSQRPNGLLPVTSDIAATVGYKLNDKATVGIGASYKLGWGNSISHISMSNQGIGLRTYIDVKLKGSFWITGGYEQNWLPELKSKLDSLPAGVYSSNWGKGWQSSGLVGLTKKIKIGKKTSNVQLLWDFLSYQQIPRTQPLKFRVGYVF
jgi:hypothetical protein